jgi:hypothetical protein
MNKINFAFIGDAEQVRDEVVDRLLVDPVFKPVPGATNSQKPLPQYFNRPASREIAYPPPGSREADMQASASNSPAPMAEFILGQLSDDCCLGPQSRGSLGVGEPIRGRMLKTLSV